MRVAVASDDGKSIQQHFGRTSRFLIYEIDGLGARFIEWRENEPSCNPARRLHSEARLAQSVDLISDCRAVLAAQIGSAAQDSLNRNRITPLEVTGLIDTVLSRLSRNVHIIAS